MPPRKIDKRFLYIRERDQTFLGTTTPRGKEVYQWPHVEPSGTQMAEAGFYFTPTKLRTDEVTCFHCKKRFSNIHLDSNDVYTWHLEQSPNCYYAKLLVLKVSTESPPPEFSIQDYKDLCLKTYQNWPHEHVEGLSSASMSDAGMYYSPSNSGDDSVTCALCGVELDGWEPSDNPHEEHRESNPDCFLFISEEVPGQLGLISEPIAEQEIEDISTQDEKDDSYTYIESEHEMSSPMKIKIAATVHNFKRRRRQKYGIGNTSNSRELELSDDDFHSSSIPQVDITNEESETTRKRKIDSVTTSLPKPKRSALLDASDDSIQFSVSPKKNNSQLKMLESSILDKKNIDGDWRSKTPDKNFSPSSFKRDSNQGNESGPLDELINIRDSPQMGSKIIPTDVQEQKNPQTSNNSTVKVNHNSLSESVISVKESPEQEDPNRKEHHHSPLHNERPENVIQLNDERDQASRPFMVSPEDIIDVPDEDIQEQPESPNHLNFSSTSYITNDVDTTGRSLKRRRTSNKDIQIVEDSQISNNVIILPTKKDLHIDNNSEDKSNLHGQNTGTKNSKDSCSKITTFILESFSLHGNQGLGDQLSRKASIKVKDLTISELISSPILLDKFRYIKCREPERKEKYTSYSFYYSQIGLGTSTLKAATHKLTVKIYFSDPSVWHLKAVRMGREYFSELYTKTNPSDSSVLKIPVSDPNNTTKEGLGEMQPDEEDDQRAREKPKDQLDNENKENDSVSNAVSCVQASPIHHSYLLAEANTSQTENRIFAQQTDALPIVEGTENSDKPTVTAISKPDEDNELILDEPVQDVEQIFEEDIAEFPTEGPKSQIIDSQELRQQSPLQPDQNEISEPMEDDLPAVKTTCEPLGSNVLMGKDTVLNHPQEDSDAVLFLESIEKGVTNNIQESAEKRKSNNVQESNERKLFNDVQESAGNQISNNVQESLEKEMSNNIQELAEEQKSNNTQESNEKRISNSIQKPSERCQDPALATQDTEESASKQIVNQGIKPIVKVPLQRDEFFESIAKPQPEEKRTLSEQNKLTIPMLSDTSGNCRDAFDEHEKVKSNEIQHEACSQAEVLAENLAHKSDQNVDQTELQRNKPLGTDVIDDTKDSSNSQHQDSATGSTSSEAKTPPKVSLHDIPIREGRDHSAAHLNLNSSGARMSFKTSPLGLSTSPNAFLEIEAPELKEANESKSDPLWKKCDRRLIFESLDQFDQSAKLLKKITESSFQGLSDDMDGLLTAFIAEMPEEELNMTIREWCIHNALQNKALLEATYDKMIKKFQDEAENAVTILRGLEVDD
ncbi:BA75_04544T0 [Komagataella pastoris]|uniref:BA75_04544T0 n=1 Tax=Komagataella pastoris TaxID=4922 RepID=A0A1B2JI70_PICPA|nr:BA75_04544T0 [Komagataella pastoris]